MNVQTNEEILVTGVLNIMSRLPKKNKIYLKFEYTSQCSTYVITKYDDVKPIFLAY